MTERLKLYVKDKSIPLDQRWELFIQNDLGEHRQFYEKPEGIDWNKYNLYDDFYIPKHSSTSANNFIFICEDKMNEDNEFTCDLNKVKEFFLQNFIKGFTNDW